MCDNKTRVHLYNRTRESGEIIELVCERCKKRVIFRKDKEGRVDNRAWMKENPRDTLQAWDNLYYREYPERMSVI